MALDRALSEAQPVGDRRVAQPVGDEVEDLALTRGERLVVQLPAEVRVGLTSARGRRRGRRAGKRRPAPGRPRGRSPRRRPAERGALPPGRARRGRSPHGSRGMTHVSRRIADAPSRSAASAGNTTTCGGRAPHMVASCAGRATHATTARPAPRMTSARRASGGRRADDGCEHVGPDAEARSDRDFHDAHADSACAGAVAVAVAVARQRRGASGATVAGAEPRSCRATRAAARPR